LVNFASPPENREKGIAIVKFATEDELRQQNISYIPPPPPPPSHNFHSRSIVHILIYIYINFHSTFLRLITTAITTAY